MGHHDNEVDNTMAQNELLLEGTVRTAPEWSHDHHNTHFYRFFLEVPRLSGEADVLPVLVAEHFLSRVEEGQRLRFKGQLRSYNNRSGIGNRLVLTVYPTEILPPEGESCNHIVLSGNLCKIPIFRRTPLGRSICDLMLAVPRRYGRADYLPLIAWGQLAVYAEELSVGDALSVEGRVQSRLYHKTTEGGVEERTAYEVSVMHLLEPQEA
jgi:primosomal replication protein N